ncbi:MAG: ABC transporter permease subunit [Candidatus Promineifilaceae bacterium]|jgi:ABC-type sugar transport system permease subunit
MSSVVATEMPQEPDNSQPSATLGGMVIRLILLAIFDVLAVWLIVGLFGDGYWPLGVMISLITIFVNIVMLRAGMYPMRWMVIGLSLMALLSVYPILYTVWIAFTNYGDGHLLTQQQSIDTLERQTYLPETGAAYSWTAFQTPEGEYALWLIGPDGHSFIARPDQPLEEVTDPEQYGPLDENGIPLGIEGYKRLARLQTVAIIDQLGAIQFGEGEDIVRVRNLDSAAVTQPRYVYDPDTNTMVDQVTGTVYTPIQGTWTAEDGSTLPGGYWVGVGFSNFTRFFSSSAIALPLLSVTIWNFIFPFVTVLTTFFLGLFTAMLFNDLPGRKLIRSLLIIPYTIPSLVTILVWRGMFLEPVGIIYRTLVQIFGSSPAWMQDPFWAKVGILIVNLWLGYPYFMLVCSGALTGIPQDIYSAADVDGANAWQKFWKLTMPLLLVAVGPLLVASYVFNFNNFNVIYLYNSGGPPIAGASTPIGHTDILISYVYKLAFAGFRGADFGFAAAISIIIFFVVILITLFQFRYTNMWEEAN